MNNKIMSLAGNWKIVKDPKTIGKIEGWQKGIPNQDIAQIEIPCHIPNGKEPCNYSYSNVFTSYHGIVWYYKELPQLPKREDDEIILIEFERAGYLCEVFVNGEFVGEHRHHEERFSYDITPYLKGDGKDLCICPYCSLWAAPPVYCVQTHKCASPCFASRESILVLFQF